MEAGTHNAGLSVDERIDRLRRDAQLQRMQAFSLHRGDPEPGGGGWDDREDWSEWADAGGGWDDSKVSEASCIIVLQPTPFCNINCRYCYLAQRSSRERMTMSTLARICQLLFSSPLITGHLFIVWHAGEPLALPVSFYRTALRVIEAHNVRGIKITHAFQTNGTLITQEWCEFIKEHHIVIGVSLDGPQYLHDRNRVDRAGHGTFERALRGVRLLLANHITPSIIMVLTRDALPARREILDFFQQEGLSRVGFSAEEVEGVNLHSSLETDEDIAQFRQFFVEALRESESRPWLAAVREIAGMRTRILTPSLPKRIQENQPLLYLNFDYRGGVSTFSPELLSATHDHYGTFVFGNVFELNALEDIQDNPTFQKVNADIQRGIQRCQETCAYFSLCGGGAPSNKLCEHGTFNATETTHCRLVVKAVADTVLEHLEAQRDLTSALLG